MDLSAIFGSTGGITDADIDRLIEAGGIAWSEPVLSILRKQIRDGWSARAGAKSIDQLVELLKHKCSVTELQKFRYGNPETGALSIDEKVRQLDELKQQDEVELAADPSYKPIITPESALATHLSYIVPFYIEGYDHVLKDNLVFGADGKPLKVRPSDVTRFPACDSVLQTQDYYRKHPPPADPDAAPSVFDPLGFFGVSSSAQLEKEAALSRAAVPYVPAVAEVNADPLRRAFDPLGISTASYSIPKPPLDSIEKIREDTAAKVNSLMQNKPNTPITVYKDGKPTAYHESTPLLEFLITRLKLPLTFDIFLAKAIISTWDTRGIPRNAVKERTAEQMIKDLSQPCATVYLQSMRTQLLRKLDISSRLTEEQAAVLVPTIESMFIPIYEGLATHFYKEVRATTAGIFTYARTGRGVARWGAAPCNLKMLKADFDALSADEQADITQMYQKRGMFNFIGGKTRRRKNKKTKKQASQKYASTRSRVKRDP